MTTNWHINCYDDSEHIISTMEFKDTIMKELNEKRFKMTRVILSVFLFVFFGSLPVYAQKAMLKKIVVGDNPFSINLFVTEKVPFKIVQVEPKEILIALKGVDIEKTFKIQGENKKRIQDIGVEQLQRDVTAVLLRGVVPFDFVESGFDGSSKSYTIKLEKPDRKKAPVVSKPVADPQKSPAENQKKPVASEKTTLKEEIKKEAVPEKETAKIVAPPEKKLDSRKTQEISNKDVARINRPESPYSGDVSDLVLNIGLSPCSSPVITQSTGLLEKELFVEAFSKLDEYARGANDECMEQATFLRAYAFFRSVKPDDYIKLLQAERYFQDALIRYPESDWVPYGFASMGLIQKDLKNDAVAEGFLNVIVQGYPNYSGLPEVYYILADIYDMKGFADKAERYFREVFSTFPMSKYTMDAGIGLGKVLYQKQRFIDSLAVINAVMEADPRKVYKSHELLLYAGNADYKLGRSKSARENLIKVCNLFPDIDEKDVLLSMVGDTYGMENNSEKAMELYKFVREKYPDTQGFISSSIGLARYLGNNEDKLEIYEMIKKKFPDDKYARVAMMRIAEIYQSTGEYQKCIREIEDLLSTHPRGLRYEAVQLMQKAYEELFKNQNASDEYTDVLNIYEKNHETIDRMGARSISLSVGLAYLRANLFEQAFNHLLESYKQYDLKSRSSELLFGLGVAMDETGRDEDALKMFLSFSKRFPKDKNRVAAMIRMGDIYLDKNQYNEAISQFSEAYQFSRDRLEKGNILVKHSQVYSKKEDFNQAAVYLANAIKDFASAPGENYDLLTNTYRELGNTYLILNKYVIAADAFSKALTFSDTERLKANLGFLIGDAYQKGNAIEKAKVAYQSVAESNDSVWARLARQRLSTLELARTVQNS